MGAVLVCSDHQVIPVTQALRPRPRQQYDPSQYQPNGGYYQPKGQGYRPEWYQQDNKGQQSEQPGPRSKAVPYQNQDYYGIKTYLLEKGELFVDPEFPPTGQSLYWSKQAPNNIRWKRPHEIVSNPQLFVEGVSASDFKQGNIGNCWFIAASCNIALQPQLVGQIIPEWQKQEWSPSNHYCGIFHFHFFFFGRWIDVVIDDYLPTRNNKLVFCSSTSRNEFWSALMEKAYAKLFGDYESLRSGHARDGMVDMTGGIGQRIELKESKETWGSRAKLCAELQEAFQLGSLMSASIVSLGKDDFEKRMGCGLVKGHAYSITHVKEVPQGEGTVAMIRLRNPWGDKEWNGPWSDRSPEWNGISPQEKQRIGLVFRDDGEFWMSLNDFITYFDKVEICHMLHSKEGDGTWRGRQTWGSLRKPDRCGGCSNNDTFLQNPQYTFELDQKTDVMIYMEQVDTRIWREYGMTEQTIGFSVLKAELGSGKRVSAFKTKIQSTTYLDSRSNFMRKSLDSGRYLLVPCTFDRGKEMTFLLRIYARCDPKLSMELTD